MEIANETWKQRGDVVIIRQMVEANIKPVAAHKNKQSKCGLTIHGDTGARQDLVGIILR